jgi:hypothetical protein
MPLETKWIQLPFFVSRWVRNVSLCPNLARTAAIEVRFCLNFAVVFDLIYFHFRPSKAK